LTWIKTPACGLHNSTSRVERSQEGTMRAVSLRHRLPPNVFVRLWRRWMTAQANQLLEAARLGSDKVEYLTHGREMSNADHCRVAGRQVDDLLRRRMLALELDPYELGSLGSSFTSSSSEVLLTVREPRRLCVRSSARIDGSSLARSGRLARLL
jgi:hypothetical protein